MTTTIGNGASVLSDERVNALRDRPAKVRASFGENYARLQQVKRRYDPNNLFRLNANIAP